MIKFWHILLWMIAAQIGVIPCYAQVKLFNNDELPSEHVYQINQDNEGFIWILTDEGMVKYDGRKLKTFTVADGLPTNDIWGSEITGSKVWYLCKGDRLGYIQNDTVVSFTHLSGSFTPLNYCVNPNELLIYDNRFNLMQPIDSQWRVIHTRVTLEATRRIPISNGYFNELIIKGISAGVEDKILILNNGKRLLLKDKNENTDNKNRILIYKVFADHFFVYSDNNKVTFIDGKTGSLKELDFELNTKDKLHGNSVRYVDGKFQISFMNHLVILDSSLKIAKEYQFDPKYEAHASLLDRDGNIWLGSFSTGVHFIPAFGASYEIKQESELIRTPIIFQNKLYYTSNNKVFSFASDLPILAHEQFLYLKFKSNEKLIFCPSEYEEFHLIKTDFDSNVVRQSKSKDRKGKQVLKHMEMFYARGLNEILVGKNEVDLVSTDTIVSNNLGVYHDTVLILRNSGLYYFDKNHKASKHPLNIKEPLLCNATFDGNLVFGTAGNGLLIGNANGKVKRLLAGLTINELLNCENKYLLCATNVGLICMHEVEGQLVPYYNYTVADGLGSVHVTGMAIVDSNIFITTKKGITKTEFYTPDQINKKLNGIYLKEVLWNGAKQMNVFELVQRSSKNTSLSIDFGSIHYDPFDKLVYSFRFEGDSIFQKVENGILNINNLEIGSQAIELKAEIPFITSTSSIFKIHIKPRWFESIWFKVGMAICVFLGGFLTFRYRQELRHNAELETLKKEVDLSSFRLESLRSQMNPHFVFNSLNAIQYYITENQNDLSETYLLKFAKLIREFFDLSNERDIPLKREIELLNNYLALEKMRFDEKLNYTFKIDERLHPETQTVPSMLLQPIIENAVNHGIFHKEDPGHIAIEFKFVSEVEYEVIISDDGIGIDNSKELKTRSIQGHVSKSTQIFEERINLLNKTHRWKIEYAIANLTQEAEYPGTCVHIKIKHNDQSDIN